MIRPIAIFKKLYVFFFFNDTATTEIYTLSLHDALPIYGSLGLAHKPCPARYALRYLPRRRRRRGRSLGRRDRKSTTSELQSRQYLVCRLLLEKKKLPSLPRFPSFSILAAI